MEAYTNPNLTTWRDDYKTPFPKNSFLESCSAGWSYILYQRNVACGLGGMMFIIDIFPANKNTYVLFLSLAYWPSIITHGETFIIYQRYLHYLQLCIRIHQDKIYDYLNPYYTSNPQNLHWSRYPDENPHDVGMTQPFLTAYATTSPAHVGPLGVTALAGRATCAFFLPLPFTTGFTSPDIHWSSQASMSRRQS